MKRFGATLLVAVGLLALVVAFADLDRRAVADALTGLSWGHVAAAFGACALMYVARAARLGVLLGVLGGGSGGGSGGGMSMTHLLSISGRHTVFNLILPLRSGEATLPLMLKAEAGHSLAQGTAALVVCRVLDLLSVSAFLLAGLAITSRAEQAGAPQVVTTMGFVLGGALLVTLAMRPTAAGLAGWVERRGWSDGRLGGFAAATGRHLSEVSTGRLAGATAASLVTWLFNYGTCYLCLRAMAAPGGPAGSVEATLQAVSFPQALVGTTALHITGILPINTPAGVGSWEAGWTAGFVLAGVPAQAAAASAVGSHVLTFGFALILGLAALLARPTPARPGPMAETL